MQGCLAIPGNLLVTAFPKMLQDKLGSSFTLFVFAPAILRDLRLRLQLDAKRTKKIKAVTF